MLRVVLFTFLLFVISDKWDTMKEIEYWLMRQPHLMVLFFKLFQLNGYLTQNYLSSKKWKEWITGKPHMCLWKRAGQSPINLNPRAISGVKNSSSRIPHLETNPISRIMRTIEESNLFKHVNPLHFSRLHSDACDFRKGSDSAKNLSVRRILCQKSLKRKVRNDSYIK